MLNRVELIGRLGANPEAKDTKDGDQMALFNLATSEFYKTDDGKKEVTDWHRVVAFRHIAEFVINHLKKGRLIYLEGKLKTRQWEDDNGNTRYLTEVRATKIIPLDTKKGKEEKHED